MILRVLDDQMQILARNPLLVLSCKRRLVDDTEQINNTDTV